MPGDTTIGNDEPATDGRLDSPFLPFEHIEVVGIGCGLFEGVLFCWGEDYGLGLLGYGLGDASVDFTQALELGGVPIDAPVTTVDSGARSDVVDTRICALTETGQLFCWGSSPTLGYPGIDSVMDKTPAQLGPLDIGSDTVVGFDVGGLGVCALLDGGDARCWGAAALTGASTVGDDEVPADGPLLDLGEPIRAVSVGDAHACAIVGDGRVKCWGGGTKGEFGQSGVFSASPSASLEPVVLGGPAVEIVARIETSCARLESGDVVCWGSGQYGQTGHPWPPDCEVSSDPLFGFVCSADSSCCVGDDETPQSVGPVELPRPARDSVGTSSGPCALLDDDSVYCWGGAYFGLIGDGRTPDCYDQDGWSCALDADRCVGDDETPAAADRAVVLN